MVYPKDWICAETLIEFKFYNQKVKDCYLESHFKSCEKCNMVHTGQTTLHAMYPDIVPPSWFKSRMNSNSKKYKQT
jgi:hypothetical protein